MPAPTPLTILYDEALPNRYAATIQMLRTARAMAAAGRPVTFGHAAGPDDGVATLTQLGLASEDRLRFESIFAPARWPRLARLTLAERRVGGLARHPGAILARGETGMAILPRLARRRSAGGAALIYEIHRLAGRTVQEAALGRSARPDDPCGRRARRALARDLAAARAADAHVFLTEAVRDAALAAGFPHRPSLVLPSGTAVPGSVATERDLDVVYVGKIAARKGVPMLLDVMRLLPRRQLDVAGGSAEEAEALRASGPGNVRVHGWLGYADAAALLARAKVGACLLPVGHDSVSDSFSSPMKLLDMMAAGLAVVATDTASVRAIATDGQDAVLVAPNDAGAAAAAIEGLLRDDERRAHLGAAARRTASGYDWSVRARRLGALVDEVTR